MNDLIDIQQRNQATLDLFISENQHIDRINHRRLSHGTGINDAAYATTETVDGMQIKCPFYRCWQSMLSRCYSAKFQKKRPTYIGCTVCDEWHSFMTFKKWMETQDWQDKHLDKDILNPKNKIYSPTTCLFVSAEINSLLSSHDASRGEYPIGVYYDKDRQKFISQIKINGKKKHLGYFKTPEHAHHTYLKAKAEHIQSIISQQDDVRVVAGLMQHAAELWSQRRAMTQQVLNCIAAGKKSWATQ